MKFGENNYRLNKTEKTFQSKTAGHKEIKGKKGIKGIKRIKVT